MREEDFTQKCCEGFAAFRKGVIEEGLDFFKKLPEHLFCPLIDRGVLFTSQEKKELRQREIEKISLGRSGSELVDYATQTNFFEQTLGSIAYIEREVESARVYLRSNVEQIDKIRDRKNGEGEEGYLTRHKSLLQGKETELQQSLQDDALEGFKAQFLGEFQPS